MAKFAKSAGRNEFGITVDEAVSELSLIVEESVNFLFSEFGSDWEKAERYFAGGCDIELVEGRSQVVKTEVRDSIRAAKPSIMRTLLQSRKIVEYIPNQLWGAGLAEQQSEYVTQQFWKNGGYKMILSCVDESMKKKIGPVKTFWEENPHPEYNHGTGMSAEEITALDEADDIEFISIEERSIPSGGNEQVYDAEWNQLFYNGKVCMEAFPAIEFFINRNATGIDGAVVHGHRRDVTVSEALELGLDYGDWWRLDSDDPEQNQHQGESYERRRYQKNSTDDMDSKDLANHLFLLTECYCSFDLDGTGALQKYVFWLGGTGYTYLGHDKIDDWCIDLVEIDPVPFAPLGRSLADLTMNEQEMNTSVLRAITDNFHMANNPRYAANPLLTDFNDLMNNAIGAPVKNKNGGQIDVLDIPFTGQQGLPLLQYLEQDVQNKVGVTKASQGLDPDAMQSTDKDAVRNTIMLAQGQVELMVRNIIETGLIPLFRKMLRLSIRHMDRRQIIRSKGMVVPVDQSVFDPNLVAEPNVGLGSAAPEQKMQGLLFILSEQKETLGTFGMDNPFVSLTNIYNTLEDITELSGFHDVGRYFNLVTPEIEEKLAQQRQKAQEQQEALMAENQPMDPSKALMSIESGKSRIKMMEITAGREGKAKQLQFDSIKFNEESDIKRDQMIQDRILELTALREQNRASMTDERIREMQERNNRLHALESAANANAPISASESVQIPAE
jgi:hypothetical protein